MGGAAVSVHGLPLISTCAQIQSVHNAFCALDTLMASSLAEAAEPPPDVGGAAVSLHRLPLISTCAQVQSADAVFTALHTPATNNCLVVVGVQRYAATEFGMIGCLTYCNAGRCAGV